jgi:hypothetical protein
MQNMAEHTRSVQHANYSAGIVLRSLSYLLGLHLHIHILSGIIIISLIILVG